MLESDCILIDHRVEDFSALDSSTIDKYHGGKCPKLKCKFSLSYVLLKVVLVYEELAYRK